MFFFYYKYLVVNTGDKSKRRDKIIGSMKDPEDWRGRNNKMAYVSLFWTIISIIVFIYLKFFYQSGLISIIYVFVYLVAVVLSVSLFLKQNKVVGSK
jgi:magnesium-transporting ATPase (P-type)